MPTSPGLRSGSPRARGRAVAALNALGYATVIIHRRTAGKKSFLVGRHLSDVDQRPRGERDWSGIGLEGMSSAVGQIKKVAHTERSNCSVSEGPTNVPSKS